MSLTVMNPPKTAKKNQSNEVAAVLISDIHFSVPNLELAKDSLGAALQMARDNKCPIIIAGDLLDSKAIIRAECANAVINLFNVYPDLNIVVIPGNHDMINEKSCNTSLNFLSPYCHLITSTEKYLGYWFIPYMADHERLIKEVKKIPRGSTVIMHQGVKGAYMGHYVQDKSSVRPEIFDGLNVISGHYHRAQEVKCGKTGKFTYIGSPYTMTFGEAEDGPKGFRTLSASGEVRSVPTNLRKHIKITKKIEDLFSEITKDLYGPSDIIWLTVTGPRSELAKLKKSEIGERLFGHSNFKLDYKSTEETKTSKEDIKFLTAHGILDAIIEGSGDTKEQIYILKSLWRELVS